MTDNYKGTNIYEKKQQNFDNFKKNIQNNNQFLRNLNSDINSILNRDRRVPRENNQ